MASLQGQGTWSGLALRRQPVIAPTSAATGCAIERRCNKLLIDPPLKLVSGRAKARPRANVQSVTQAPPGWPWRAPRAHTRAAAGQSPFPRRHAWATLLPNPSVNLTRYGRRRLAAPAKVTSFPSAANQRPPPRAGYLKRWAAEELAAHAPARNSPALHLTPDGESAEPRHLVGAGAKAPASQSPTSAATGCAIERRRSKPSSIHR